MVLGISYKVLGVLCTDGIDWPEDESRKYKRKENNDWE